MPCPRSGARRLDRLKVGLELFDTPLGRRKWSLTALDPGRSPASISACRRQRQSLHRDAELFDEVLARFAGTHAFTGSATDLGKVVPWHV